MNFADRQVLGAVGEAVRREWAIGDAALGALGTAFTLLYAAVGLPFGRIADRAVRRRLLSAGVAFWSVLTFASGLTQTYWQLFAARLGVGIGEATCAPTATSLIADLFPARRRARALSVFMLGLPLGLALGYVIGGAIGQRWGWRAAFFVAGLPGLVCAVAALRIREPPRGASDDQIVHEQLTAHHSIRLVLAVPTMWWLIASGVLHTFSMSALGVFLSPLLIRFHGVNLERSGLMSMGIYGLSGLGGLIIGGAAADAAYRRRVGGRLLVGVVAMAVSAPLMLLALARPRGDLAGFAWLMGIGCSGIYAYYAVAYSTIHDVILPSARGTAMAVFFLAVYACGAALGPLGTGLLSEFFTSEAAAAAGSHALTSEALEPFRAEGLHGAIGVIPWLVALVAFALYGASRTVERDIERMRSGQPDRVR